MERPKAYWYVWRRLIGQRRTELREEMMQTRLGISGVVLVLSASVSVQTATACSKEAVAGAVDMAARRP
jgi:hypothetical protein